MPLWSSCLISPGLDVLSCANTDWAGTNLTGLLRRLNKIMLTEAQHYMDRRGVCWCQRLLLLCSLHSNLMSGLVFINISQENAHQISGYVTPFLSLAWFLICPVRWSDYRVWPWRPFPSWILHSLVIIQSSCNHCRKMTPSLDHGERTLPGPGDLSTFLPIQMSTSHLFAGLPPEASPGSVCAPQSLFFRQVQQPVCPPEVLFIHF